MVRPVSERQDCDLTLDLIAHQVEVFKAANNGYLYQCLLNSRIVQQVPLQRRVNTQNRRRWVKKPTTLLAHLGIVRLDQDDKQRPGHESLDIEEELLAFKLFLVGD